jgi:hypothetical protein
MAVRGEYAAVAECVIEGENGRHSGESPALKREACHVVSRSVKTTVAEDVL